MLHDYEARMQGGVLTFRSNDGYIVSAPVEGFSVAVDADYADVYIDDYLSPQSIFKTSETVTFSANLKYGESYTIRDLGVKVYKTFVIKGYHMEIDRKRLPALGIDYNANMKYNQKKDETKFFWEERIVVDDE